MNNQHPVFARFNPYAGSLQPSHRVDFLGTAYRQEFWSGGPAPRDEADAAGQPHPPFDEEYFEWIDLLESALEARDSYVMMELGAGFGRWAVRAAHALTQVHPGMPCRLVAVEPEPVVYGWMRQHFLDNGLNPDAHSLIHGAVTEYRGKAPFYIGGPRGGPFDRKPEEWYGQFLTNDYDAAAGGRLDGVYAGFQVTEHRSGWRSIQVPVVTLASLLRAHRRVDLIDMDLEGQELPSVSANIKGLDARVKRLHIATHSAEIEAALRKLLNSHKWDCRADYPAHTRSQTPWGEIAFENGAQSWVNPRLA